jgi:hypothetical protein
MELIPILSLIILVATISTFILSVGAYILYKVRERKGVTTQAAQPAALPAELLAPAPLMSEQRLTPERRTFDIPQQEFGFEYQRQPSNIPYEESSRGPELDQLLLGHRPLHMAKDIKSRPENQLILMNKNARAPRKNLCVIQTKVMSIHQIKIANKRII